MRIRGRGLGGFEWFNEVQVGWNEGGGEMVFALVERRKSWWRGGGGLKGKNIIQGRGFSLHVY